MAKLVKFEVVDLPKIYLVGKESRHCIELHIKGDNRIPAFWDKCFAEGVFSTLEKQQEYIYAPAYVGVSTDWDMGYGNFSYICGMLFKEGVTVPEGFAVREFGGEKAGLCWIKGKADDVCSNAHVLAGQAIKDAGLRPDKMKWCMEFFNHPRYTTPDENEEVILDFYIPINKSFESLGNRIIYSYLATFPAFKPVANCSASESSQRQMHEFLHQSIKTINSDPSVINIEYEPDDCYEDWEMNNSKPELIRKMQKVRNNFLSFYEHLIKMGLSGEVGQDKLFIRKNDMRIPQKIKDKLSLFGLICDESKDGCTIEHNRFKELFPAWKLHCCISKDDKIRSKDIMNFLYGSFGGKQYAAAEIFGSLKSPVIISELEQYFLKKGYICKNDELRVSYKKEYPEKQKAHMNIFFDWRKTNQMIFEFKAPHFSKAIKYYGRMDDELKALVYGRTKICDGCGYCNQTDKTGKRPRLTTALEFNDERKPKCPLFPSFTWGNLNESTVGLVKKLFDFSEDVINSK